MKFNKIILLTLGLVAFNSAIRAEKIEWLNARKDWSAYLQIDMADMVPALEFAKTNEIVDRPAVNWGYYRSNDSVVNIFGESNHDICLIMTPIKEPAYFDANETIYVHLHYCNLIPSSEGVQEYSATEQSMNGCFQILRRSVHHLAHAQTMKVFYYKGRFIVFCGDVNGNVSGAYVCNKDLEEKQYYSNWSLFGDYDLEKSILLDDIEKVKLMPNGDLIVGIRVRGGSHVVIRIYPNTLAMQ